MSYPRVAPGNRKTTADCHKQVHSWRVLRLLRTMMEFLIPTCNCTFVKEDNDSHRHKNSTRNKINPQGSASQHYNKKTCHSRSNSITSLRSSTTKITGTIFGNRHGKVKLCIQTHPNSSSPILLLQLPVSTSFLAKEMQGGLLHIELKCTGGSGRSLLSVPVWTMYCNGMKVGLAVKRKPLKTEMEVLKKIGNVVVGTDVVNGEEIGCGEDDVMYIRGNYDRIIDTVDAESYHLIDYNDGSVNEDLSIFFRRSR